MTAVSSPPLGPPRAVANTATVGIDLSRDQLPCRHIIVITQNNIGFLLNFEACNKENAKSSVNSQGLSPGGATETGLDQQGREMIE